MRKSRAEAFSDGVFAVAATLLVFNLVDPKVDSGLSRALVSEWPSYAAHAISFSTIVVIWVNHHAVTDTIERFDRSLLFINGLLLLTIAVVPFPTGLLAHYLQAGHDQITASVAYGLTMTTMDVIDHFGGKPANFLEIGGEAYTKAEVALDLVLSNPGVKSLVVNFCGAFARTDVMAEGVVLAWESLKPKIPAFFSIHGTGEDEAVKLVRERLGIEAYDFMEDAVKAAVEAAK